MKRNFLFSVFAMLLCLMGGGSAWAAVTVTLPIENQNVSADQGNKYQVVLYNVGAKAFLTHGNDWGTRASVADFINTNDFRIQINNGDLTSSWIHLCCYNENNKDLFVSNDDVANIYCDANPDKWNEVEKTWTLTLSEDRGYYTIQNKNHSKFGGRYLGLQAGTTIVDLQATTVSDNTKWKIMQVTDDWAAKMRLYYLIVKADALGLADAVATAETSYNTETTAAGFNAAYDKLCEAALAQTSMGSDMTLGIKDAAVTDGYGWESFSQNGGQQYTGAPDVSYMDVYNGDKNAKEYTIYQYVNVKKGVYQLKAATRGHTGATGNIFMDFDEGSNKWKQRSKDINIIGSEGGELGGGWGWTVVDNIEIPKDGRVRIGFWSKLDPGEWAGADNFQLTYLYNPVTMTIKAANKWATFVAPFDFDMPEGVTAKTITGYDGSKLIYEDITTTYIPKNTPVVVHSESESDTEVTRNGDAASESESKVGLLTGVHTDGVVNNGNYVLQNQGSGMMFHIVNEKDVLGRDKNNFPITAGRAYLTLPSGSAPQFIGLDDETTGIAGVQQSEAFEGEAYDLTGRRVSVQGKGLYIVNGKKIVK